METFVLHERIFADERYLALDPSDRETYFRLSIACDPNWGHTSGADLFDVTARIYPELARRALRDGDPKASTALREREEGLCRIAEAGLFIIEDTRDGVCVAYSGWENYTGKHRNRRGIPKFPMGPRTAATREWTRSGNNTAKALADFAKRYGLCHILGIATDESEQPWLSQPCNETAVAEPTVHSRTTRALPEARSQKPESGCRTPDDEPTDANKLPGGVHLPEGCAALVREVARRDARALWTQAVKCWPATVTLAVFREETVCESPEQWLVALALDVQSEDKPEFRRRSYQSRAEERGCPTEPSRAKAARMLSGDDDKPAKTRPELVVDYSGDDGWGSRE